MKDKPNILLLFSDQHNASVLGFEYHADVITPNLDKLAAEGVCFHRAYCQDAICMPSRVSMHAGLYPRRLGLFNNEDRSERLNDIVPMASVFKSNGYTTAAFGKRHLCEGYASDNGWDIHKSHLADESPEDNYVKWVDIQGYGKEFMLDWSAEFAKGASGGSYEDVENPFAVFATRMSELPENMTMEAYTAKETIEFIKEQKNSDKPFFCWSSFYRPHQPYTPLQKYFDMYDASKWGKGRKFNDGIKMPDSLREDIQNQPPAFVNMAKGRNRVWRTDLARENEQIYRDYIASYYALVTEIDYHIGEIVATLKEQDMLDNTIISYTADHGDFVGAHGMVEKHAGGHNVYEETLRVPLIFYWKNKLHICSNSSDLVELVDLYPTLMELAELSDLPRKDMLEGKSLKNTIKTGESLNRQYSVSENKVHTTVITDKFKLCIPDKSYENAQTMLFAREQDPHEVNNLAGKTEYAEIEKELSAYIEKWKKRFK